MQKNWECGGTGSWKAHGKSLISKLPKETQKKQLPDYSVD